MQRVRTVTDRTIVRRPDRKEGQIVNKPIMALIGFALVLFAHTGVALAVQIEIDPADYTGQWTVDDGPAQKGPVVVDLGAPDPTTGSHVIGIGGAQLFFDVADDGTVTAKNPSAAKGGPGKLTFSTISIVVDPQFFRGTWKVANGATAELTGLQAVTLVRGLRYYSLEVGANGGFLFDIADDGTVVVRNDLAGAGGPGSLTLGNTERFSVQAQ